MGAITISREYGSDGRTIGRKVAEALECFYLGKELIVAVAHRAEMPVAELERYDEHPENAAVRILKKLLLATHGEALYGAADFGWWPLWNFAFERSWREMGSPKRARTGKSTR
jgi:hypothetical protein